jgi:N,N'-diacetyllegionaminate synthase
MHKNKLPFIIFELANTHNGKFSLLRKSVNFINTIEYKNKGIKFQIFDPDKISSKNYQWYKVYKKLFFNPEKWQNIIKYASKFSKVYLDIFDVYGVEVLKNNLNYISGIKIQSSIINNHNVYKELMKINYNKNIILNISGFYPSDIRDILRAYKRISRKIILQVGFQDYPTKIEYTGLNKIFNLRKIFKNYEFSLADHIDGNDNFSTIIPLIANFYRINIVEKHFCLSKSISKYDLASSLEPKQVFNMINNIHNYNKLFSEKSFVSKYEKKYLLSTQQQTLPKKHLSEGSLVSLNDVEIKRSNKKGMDFQKISNLQNKKYILRKNKIIDSVFFKEDFKKAKIGILVACRMKSTRLKNKALLYIGKKPSIVHCINNCQKSKFAHSTVLCTSSLKEDDSLADLKIKKNFKIFRGDPEDVIDRYIQCSKKYNIDIIVRVTGDCPVISSEIIDFLIEKHFRSGADYTAARNFSVGTSAEIINTRSLYLIKKLRKYNISEYMTFYFLNNPEYFKLNIVDLPKIFIRNYRLTLDHKEDLEMFNKLLINLKKNKLQVNIKNIYKILDNNKKISNINSNKKLIYKTNKNLVNYLNKSSKF